MKRRTLLKTALALPMVQPWVPGTATARMAEDQPRPPNALFCGLPGLDYALEGIAPASLIGLAGPTCTGKTMLLLELAARLSIRYRQNVVFYSAHKPSVYLAKKANLRGDIPFRYLESVSHDDPSAGASSEAALYLIDANGADPEGGYETALRLRRVHPAGCVAFILDGWSSQPQGPGDDIEFIGEVPYVLSDPWPHSTVIAPQRFRHLRTLVRDRGLPVIFGLTTASLIDEEALSATFSLESAIRCQSDRWVVLHRPELYQTTEETRPAERNLVRLTGTGLACPHTRYAELRYNFSTSSFATAT